MSRHKQGHSSFSGQALKQVLTTDTEMESQKTQACVTSHYKARASRRQEGFRATVTLKWKDQQHEGYKYTAPCVSQQGPGYTAEQQRGASVCELGGPAAEVWQRKGAGGGVVTRGTQRDCVGKALSTASRTQYVFKKHESPFTR